MASFPTLSTAPALFEIDGRRFLVRNSEQDGDEADRFPTVAAPELTYDPVAQGGTTTTELDADNNVVAEYVSLAGTVNNCAGGVTPWGTWLTCEETEERAGDDGFTKDHGFVFEVDPFNVDEQRGPDAARRASAASPTRPSSSTRRPACCTSPRTPAARTACSTGRRRPTPLGGYGSLRDGAAARGARRLRRTAASSPTSRSITEIGTVLTTDVGGDPRPARRRGLDPGPAQQGHPLAQVRGHVVGQRRRLRRVLVRPPRRRLGRRARRPGVAARPGADTMELIVQFGVNPDPASDTFDGPDNITVSPWGGLSSAADGEGVQHLFTVSADGEPALRPQRTGRRASSPAPRSRADGKTLFVNLQEPGVTFAITGPWEAHSARPPGTSTP